MRFLNVLFVLAVFTGLAANAQQPPRPSLKYTTVSVYGGTFGFISGVRTQYMLGHNTRMDSREGQNGHFGPRRATIWNRDLHCAYNLDLDAKIYTVLRIDDRGLPVDPLPIKVKNWQPSGRRLTIHIENVDTGERREMFGYTARHVKMRRTEIVSPPGDSSQNSFEVDGWVIEPRAWPQLHPVGAGVVLATAGDEETRIIRNGPPETGLPVIRTSGPSYDRVIQFSENPLDPALFEPPADFQRVPALPAPQFNYQYGWEMRAKLFKLMLMDRL